MDTLILMTKNYPGFILEIKHLRNNLSFKVDLNLKDIGLNNLKLTKIID